MAERQFGPYRLVRQIAVGGMAEIHLAKTKGIAGFEKYVALKMIHPNFAEDEQFIQMLVDEAKIAVQLTHGNIAQTFDLGRVGDTYYITMEYVDGSDLYKLLRKASESDIEMPLDICAFVAKETASALDHAHRKRDHTGKSLGIVHRDVSPQNVLVSYAGEVKLVDFGIAKATMKARQTAAGVIKGKYYYMSPEQAWGDPLDFRSDIFSAGIVLYEMITGQMLYLEEDLQKLLDMARKADIAPPSTLRKGVPPQLERIVMHALHKVPGERYQSAGDLATDLERFLHAYSPVFTAAKLSGMLRQVVGEPLQVADEDPEIEVRSGSISTHSIDQSQFAHHPDEIRDENSVIFHVDSLQGAPQGQVPKAKPAQRSAKVTDPLPMSAAAVPSLSAVKAPPQVTKASPQAAKPQPQGKIPSVARKLQDVSNLPQVAERPIAKGVAKLPTRAQPAVKPRQFNEETRELTAPPPSSMDDLGALAQPQPRRATPKPASPQWDHSETHPGDRDLLNDIGDSTDHGLENGQVDHGDHGDHGDDGDDGENDETGDEDLENAGERTMITGPGFMAAADAHAHAHAHESSDDVEYGGVDATMVNAPAPTRPESDTDVHGDAAADDGLDEDGPTIARDFRDKRPTSRKPAVAPPAALAAKIEAPAVSALHRPRASRKTPPGGVPAQQPSALKAMIGSQGSSPMPAPSSRPRPPTQPPPPPAAQTQIAPPPGQTQIAPPPGQTQIAPPPGYPSQPSQSYPQQPQQPQPQQPYQSQPQYPQPPYQPPGQPPPSYPQQPPYQQGYQSDASGMPMGVPTPPAGIAVPPYSQPAYEQPYQGQQPQHVTPGAMYANPYGQRPQQPLSITGQLRLSEVDEMPSHYNLASKKSRWIVPVLAVLAAIGVVAAIAFYVVRSQRDAAPQLTAVHVESTPSGADVLFDGKLVGKTPWTIDQLELGSSHAVKVALDKYKPFEEAIQVPKNGVELTIQAQLKPITGKLSINTVPRGAEILINGQSRGRTPTSFTDLDVSTAKKLELRLKDYEPVVQDLVWPENGEILLDLKLKKP